LGLTAFQKIVFQLAISIFVGIFVYKSELVGSVLIVPFTTLSIDVGFWIIPIVAIIYLATTNSVNLTDGLDGLASSTTVSYMLCFLIILSLFVGANLAGLSEIMLTEFSNISTLCAVTIGSLICFLTFNCFPAKIFMGDTGSLALGSLVASVAVFSRMSLFIPILGIMFVASSVSVILQVAYYKLTRKRIFLMAPLHHHFEQKGVHEVRITICYAVVTIFAGALVAIFSIF
jgi:phospho-N-acetylmuramoyl-pentapeptide-transferase